MKLFNRGSNTPQEVLMIAENKKLLAFTYTQNGPVVATEDGIASKSFSIQWYSMFQANFDPPVLKISYQSELGPQQISLTLEPLLESNEFANLVRAKVTSNVIAQTKVEYQENLSVTFSARKLNHNEIQYVISADKGIDTDGLEFKNWADTQLREFREIFGV
jgi:hypothetical protein